MKQELSVLKWAALMMEREVKNLDSVQNVPFVKTLLWRIDPDYFYQWEHGGKGSQNFSSVLSEIEKYFREEIGTNIKEHLDSLNIYKDPMDIWELLLGIAIKGNNRGENITLILDMDHAIQAELMGIVSGIIDKFGQNTAQNNQDLVEEDSKEDGDPGTSQQMILDLAKQNEELNDQIDELTVELEKLKQDNKALGNQKKEVEEELIRLKHEKTAFIDIMASANRTESRIFDNGEENVLSSPSLSELANDLTIFVRELKKKLAQEQEKSSVLEEHLRETEKQAIRCVQQNQSYLLQLGNLNAYEHQIEHLRDELSKLFEDNSQLYDTLNHLEEQRARLLANLQAKTKEQETTLSENYNQRRVTEQQKKSKSREKKTEKDNKNSEQSGTSDPDLRNSLHEMEEGSLTEKKAIRDELREPKLRNKLQRQIEFLKKSNQSLKKQNVSLKQSNQSLQKSANNFMINNKEIITRWEDDYQDLLNKINQITSKSSEVQLSNLQVQTDRAEVIEQNEVAIQFESDQPNQPRYPQLTTAFSFGIPPTKDNKESLWEEISKKLRQIVRKGKEREFSLQNTIHQLRAENLELINGSEIGNKVRAAQISSVRSSVEEVSKFNEEKDFHIDLIQASDVKSQQELKKETHLSFVSIREGEDIDDAALDKRRELGTSEFYHMGSKILAEIKELKPRPSESSLNNSYININRTLFRSISHGLQGLKNEEVEESNEKTAELEERLKEQIDCIKEHYQQLNNNFQLIFGKLQLYSSQFNQAELAKQQYQQILEQLKTVEQEIKADQEAEIVKLRLVNDQLHQGLSQSLLNQRQILEEIGEIVNQKQIARQSRSLQYENNYKMILKALEEIKIKHNNAMLEPLNFLSLRTSVNKEGEIEQFYKMYLKEKEKCRQLTEELQLLSGILLEYNTILHQ